MNTFATLFLCFALYACLGWLCESLYCSLPAGKFCNNALLHGPFSPVYGVGAICTVLAAPRWEPSLLLLFMGSVIVNTAVEYATGLLLETCFGRRWWDYSCQRHNLHGRICLKNSLYFGLMGILVVRVLHPVLLPAVASLSLPLRLSLCAVLIAYFTVDLAITSAGLLRTRKRAS